MVNASCLEQSYTERPERMSGAMSDKILTEYLWDVFTKEYPHECSICHQKFLGKKNTRNLKSHIIRHHKEHYDKFCKSQLEARVCLGRKSKSKERQALKFRANLYNRGTAVLFGQTTARTTRQNLDCGSGLWIR
ncbi:hypothetical protein KIPB_003222 [Kipferlia bialata]|uniref:BED-type domain-containing protein n=1 Tax=Kipferlia bialata TaxID=797122 RepID=A0A9K3GGV9_9EUKA|nr:hypothetical protein KIPB_003222 [Kipferlia bialata]|eukprot:g3222.t1